MKQILKTLLILLGGIVGGYLLLVLVFCLPLGRISNNVLESATSFNGEYTVLVKDNITTKTDDYTDALMLLTAKDNTDRNPFTAAIYANSLNGGDIGDDPDVVITNMENPEYKSDSYDRYWHGYLIFLKPLLMVFNYQEIQILISFAVLVLIVAVIYLLQKKDLSKYIIPYTIMVALMFPATIMLSMQYFAMFAIFNLAIAVILLFFDKILKTKNFFYLFLVIGMLTCYFDLLTYPSITLGIPLIIWLILLNKEKTLTFKKNVGQIVLGSVAWGIGYFGIWFGKWALGSVITGKNLISSALGQAKYRSSSATELEEFSRFDPITKAFETIFTNPIIFVLILLMILILVLLITKKIKFNKQKAKENLWMLIIALIPLAWYIALANHSLWHMFFTYRTMMTLFFAVGCYIIGILEKPEKFKKRKKDG